MEVIRTSLGQSLSIWDQQNQKSKSVIIQDKTGNVFTFLKYKGLLIDMEEQLLKNPNDKGAIQEKMRSQLVVGLKVGFDSAIYFGKLLTSAQSMDSVFGDCPWYKPDILYTPEKITDCEWYRKCLLNDEENKDNFGNKGCFMHQKTFKLGFLFEGEDEQYEQFIAHHKLNKDQFVVIIVE